MVQFVVLKPSFVKNSHMLFIFIHDGINEIRITPKKEGMVPRNLSIFYKTYETTRFKLLKL